MFSRLDRRTRGKKREAIKERGEKKLPTKKRKVCSSNGIRSETILPISANYIIFKEIMIDRVNFIYLMNNS